jgi:prolipoprotein diacylglyceryl transferase
MSLSAFASIPSPPSNGLHIGPFFLHAYGLAYVVGVAAAILIARRRWEKAGGDRSLVYEVALWGFPAGLIGGRIYFLITSWDQVPKHWWGPLAIWQGGLGIWGGVLGGTLAGLWVLRRRRADVYAFMDAAAPALLVAQAIGRIGNYFNQELFGRPTDLPWGLSIDAAHRPAGYTGYATFHPTFLYELIWNLGLAGVLVWLGARRRVRAPGLFALYVAGYSGFRVFEESLRIDPSQHLLGLRLNTYVAASLCVAGLVWFAAVQRRWRVRWRSGARLLAVAWLVCWAAGCGGLGFTSGSRPASRTASPPASRSAAETARLVNWQQIWCYSDQNRCQSAQRPYRPVSLPTPSAPASGAVPVANLKPGPTPDRLARA